MPATHVVEPGEHLGTIARKFGFVNFTPIWQRPENAALKALRKEPTQLAPGDEVFIPDRVQLVFERTTDASYDFKVQLDTLKLSFRLLDIDGKPRKNAPVLVRVEEPEESGEASTVVEQELVTDGDGVVSANVAIHIDSGSIEVDGVRFPVRVGGLDPIDTENGVAQRLRNLGYLPLDDGLDPSQLGLAVEDFQVDEKLPVTGSPTNIQDKLVEVYGS